jgi:serine/threonine protein phosphatase PrpC
LVAATAAKALASMFSTMPISGTDLGGKIWDTFLATNDTLVKRSGIDCSFSGATATVSVLHGTTLTTGWVGDSRAVLARREGGALRAYNLTNDHKPTLEGELQRILAAGGRVEALMVRRAAAALRTGLCARLDNNCLCNRQPTRQGQPVHAMRTLSPP